MRYGQETGKILMSWKFGIPGQVRKVIPGIGSVFGKKFDIREEMNRCHTKLAESSEVLHVLGLPGWKKMCAEYENLIEMQKATINALNQNTKDNVEEIQRRRDVQYACELWLQAMQAKRISHDETANRLNHLQGVAQNARPA